jgi:glycosyltransferase involved in cell wall biosynthesis
VACVPANLRITLIITTYNWPAALDLALQSVARQSMAPAEIIVADDGSGPATRQVVTSWQERLKTPLIHMWQADEAFVGWGREDNEIAARLYNAGISRRSLKFQALAIHLHHPLRHAQVGERNDAILRSSIEERKAWCPLGLSQHIEPVIPGVRRPEPPATEVSQPVREFA